MNDSQMAFALYKPIEGKEDDLKKVIEEHIPKLRELGLITDRRSYLAQSTDGTFIEVFEWKDAEAKRMAHSNDDIRNIWTMMEELCTFPEMSDLPEAQAGPFPNFRIVE